MRHWLRAFRKKDLANKIKEIKKLIKSNLYDEDMREDEYFFFNVKFDKHGEVILGDGSDDNHFTIFLTSKSLLQNVERYGVHHIDGTYKITINGFSCIVYGVSDISG